MDPVAHTLFGATLAEAGLKRKTALATATLVIGANLPDVDIVTAFAGSDAALYYRRGWSHGILALLIWPVLLTGAMLLWYRYQMRIQSWRASAKMAADNASANPLGEGRPQAGRLRLDTRWLFIIASMGVWSHSFLDWLNTYGIRLLMPFDGRWFYGDTLFIIDPWMWLLMISGVVLARSSSRISMAGWMILGSGMTALVTTASQVPDIARLLWILGVAMIIWMRIRRAREYGRAGGFGFSPERVAKTALLLFACYLGWMMTGSSFTTSGVERILGERGEQVVSVMPRPLPANPFLRQGVAETEDYYYLFRYRVPFWPGNETFELRHDPVPKKDVDPVIEAALSSDQVRGLVNWMRFPYYKKEELEDGWLVRIIDLRFAEPGEEGDAGFGTGVVRLDRELNPVGE